MASCLNGTSGIENWIEIKNSEDISGKYHSLSDDGIKVYLPNTFKKYNTNKYLQLLDSISSKKDYEFESKVVETLRDLEGNFYIYFDDTYGITYTINTLPYFPFSKRDASLLLGIIRLNNEKVSETQNIDFTKLTAKYSGNKKQQIFKAIYRVDYPEKGSSLFNTSYIISSNRKTVMIKLSSIYDIDFNPYIKKMVL
ncbi:hypothetical protein [Hyunsoonleella pacifica]|uniref:Uncharacterized protein n=1 Tax=Hyunsoonleella pacifica TaxID=1080224 RepID=A0A4Q9FRU5_9FLAO|nr:hypothetical protein [Hyunsoonleella pacifica]TBN18627.1 hypothetical protein EYD46_00745 [Hyunsoonleella pacifica]GGD03353.1 hypothetical protein GCM10011368_01490 [Hyunsoonleella pacifica]